MIHPKLRDAAIEIVNEKIVRLRPQNIENRAAAELRWRQSPEGRAAIDKQRNMLRDLDKSLQEARRLGNTNIVRQLENDVRRTKTRDVKEFEEISRTVAQVSKAKENKVSKLEDYKQRLQRAYADVQVVDILQDVLRM